MGGGGGGEASVKVVYSSFKDDHKRDLHNYTNNWECITTAKTREGLLKYVANVKQYSLYKKKIYSLYYSISDVTKNKQTKKSSGNQVQVRK